MTILKELGKFYYIKKISKFINSRLIYWKNKDLLSKNKKYKNLHTEKRCFIIGNGPSIKSQDLSILKEEYTFGVNNMIVSELYDVIEPDYYVLIDSNFFEIKSDLNEQRDLLLKKKHRPICIFPVIKRKFIEKKGLHKKLDIIYVAYNLENRSSYRGIRLDKFVPYSLNVINVAIFSAIYMGFKEIYLLGVDMTNILYMYDEDYHVEDGGHFYEKDEKLKSFYKNKFKIHRNEENLKIYGRVFESLRLTNDYCVKNGIKIVNLTPKSALDTFPVGKYEELFKFGKTVQHIV